jgi:thioredoxin-dependent peroxiredoxin
MSERSGAVEFQGNPLTLIGNEVKIGDKAPNFEVLDNALSPAALSSYAGKVIVISSVPSLDTPVCDVETREFNKRAAKLGDGVAMLTISMDLPFAQSRWCGAAGISHVTTLSDYRDANFGMSYGLLIKELRLLARAVLVVDRKGTIRYLELVKEITQEPNYDAALNAVNQCMAD